MSLDRTQRELLLLALPLNCLSTREARRALRLSRRLGRLASEFGEERAGLKEYRQRYVETADVAGLATEGSLEYWNAPGAVVDPRVVAYRAGFDVARAEAG